MWHNMAPQLHQKCRVCTAKDRDEVVLENLDCLFRSILSVVVWWYQLHFHTLNRYCVLHFSGALVIQDMHG